MKKNLAFLFLGFCANLLSAQSDPILLTINGQDITRSEFEYIYNKNTALNELENKDLDSYVDLFINFKLKVEAAKQKGIDTTKAFRNELLGYKKQLAKPYLIDEKSNLQAAAEYYNSISRSSYPKSVKIIQIFKQMPQNMSKLQQQKVYSEMDSIYHLFSSGVNTDFEAMVEKCSDDKNNFWIDVLQTPEDFENAVFALKNGEISKPILSPYGIHIVKILDQKQLPTFDEMKETIVSRLEYRTGVNKGIESVVNRLKKEYDFQLNQVAIDDLKRTGVATGTLFSFNNQSYDVKLFEKFAANYSFGIEKQLNSFINKTILDYEYANLANKYPDFRMLIQEYSDGMLLFEISNQEIWDYAIQNEEGQAAFFRHNRSSYKWDAPKWYGGIVFYKDKKMLKRIKKLIKSTSHSERTDALSQAFNVDGLEMVKVEEGAYAKGDNIYIDAAVYDVDTIATLKDFPYVYVFGKKQSIPYSYTEVRGNLISDYQNFLDAQWVKRLRASSRIEINNEILKTVNNH